MLESRVGERSDERDDWLASVRTLLGQRGHVTDAQAVVARAAERLPFPHQSPPDSAARMVSDIRAVLAAGHRHFTNIDTARAIAAFQRALDLAEQYPLVTAGEPALHSDLLLAHATLSRAYRQSGQDDKARRVMERLVLNFPGQLLDGSRQIPPNTIEFHNQVARDMASEGMVTLTLSTAPETRTYIGQRLLTGQKSYQLKLVPGDYRVFTVTAAGATAVRTVTLAAGEHQDLTEDLLFDATLQTQPRLALVFANEVTRERLDRQFAARLVEAAQIEDGAIILSTRTIAGNLALVGEVIDRQGAIVRTGVVFVHDNPPSSRLQALAAYLDGGSPEPGVWTSLDGPNGPERWRFGAWKWLALGLGSASVAAGLVLLRLHDRGTCDPSPGTLCPLSYDTRTGGYVALSVGALAIAGTVGALLYDRRAGERWAHVTVSPGPGGAWAVLVSGRF